MRPIRRLLVAVKDPSAGSLPAVAKATQLARAFGADLELFHVLKSSRCADVLGSAGSLVTPSEEEERGQMLQRLGRIAARARLHGVKVSVAAEWDRPVYEAIVRRAARIEADLIVAERHAGRHIAPGLFGLADWGLLRVSAVPVLLVKGSRPYLHPRILAAVDPGQAFAKPAQLDQEILRTGAAVAAALRGKLHTVHACAPVPASLSTIGAAAASGVHRTEVTQASSRFNRLLRSTGVPVARRHFVGGRASRAVRETAGRLRSDIVVMGTVSRSGLQRVLIGNSAERVLGRLPCDLLVVKPAGFLNRMPREPHVIPVQLLG